MCFFVVLDLHHDISDALHFLKVLAYVLQDLPQVARHARRADSSDAAAQVDDLVDDLHVQHRGIYVELRDLARDSQPHFLVL